MLDQTLQFLATVRAFDRAAAILCMLDGMLLVIRRGVASIKALKKGLEAIDNPSLVGIVLNDAPDFDQKNYSEKYYAHQNQGPGQSYSN